MLASTRMYHIHKARDTYSQGLPLAKYNCERHGMLLNLLNL